ncbi:3-oxo-5a-steroid 4- dehydrogenase [Coemansia biformis]|uniref:3-oxo-5a-steroid 4- dehydrogenase n=1 Tax=Coemansia biformis TaxID=1286918 RepID=A0A9W8D1J9_9FUNG|nr:3-oxo-5a-steroid 4- dehydrogenase [Coemansia biformis]
MRLTVDKRPSASRATGSPTKAAPSQFPFVVEVPATATVADLKLAIAKQAGAPQPDRQRLTAGEKKAVLEAGDALDKYGLKDGDTVFVKDLGPQLGWQTVFYIEYAGPLVFHYLVYNFQNLFYGQTFEHSALQQRAYLLIMGHFIKRELETAFVHRFSHGTMPLFNVFKNSGHYHLLSGLNLAYWIYSPATAQGTALAAQLGCPLLLSAFTGIFLFAELSNLSTHITLRNLRPPGSRVRRIPRGYGFGLVSFPNYTFEIIAWAAVAGMTRSVAALLFLVVASAQMYLWATKKHAQYKREFPDYPRARKAIFPFIA